MPQVKEECEPPSEQLANMMNGHHNTDDNSQFNGTGAFFCNRNKNITAQMYVK